MSLRHGSWSAVSARRWSLTVLLGAVAVGLVASNAHALEAYKIVRAMSDYIAGAKNLSVSYDADIEVVTVELQKIQFTSSGHVLLSRPDKLRIVRTGGYSDVELLSDGNKVTVLGKHNNTFAQADIPGTIDHVIEDLRDRYNIAMPGADLLSSRIYDALIAEINDAKHIGQGVVDGLECEHLAFRSEEVDVQLWVEIGKHPIPRKYVITSKHTTGAPQYTLRIKEWKTELAITGDEFVFKPPANAKQVNLAALVDIDEIPAGQAFGAKK
jgi:hypothetical protein